MTVSKLCLFAHLYYVQCEQIQCKDHVIESGSSSSRKTLRPGQMENCAREMFDVVDFSPPGRGDSRSQTE